MYLPNLWYVQNAVMLIADRPGQNTEKNQQYGDVKTGLKMVQVQNVKILPL
ncbi:hypothetical protein SDC9_116962 [bioreactor metagenome]|uniref:Uncharacterized protein n=1 Tax=bioreactor metagenome TaxID=1076179 RepID=A0A645BXH3_9ZZZZ